jgi:hypothetical protein
VALSADWRPSNFGAFSPKSAEKLAAAALSGTSPFSVNWPDARNGERLLNWLSRDAVSAGNAANPASELAPVRR